MSRIVFLPRITKSVYDNISPSLENADWTSEGIHLNELFKLKNTNRFFVYHEIDGIPRIDKLEDSLNSISIFDMLNDAPLPDGTGLNIWENIIDFSNIYAINTTGDSALRLILMDNSQMYSISLGKLLNDIPHAYRMEGTTVINDSTFYATTIKNGFVRFTTPAEITSNSNNVVVSPMDVDNIIEREILNIPKANASSRGIVRFSSILDIPLGTSSALSPFDTKNMANNAIADMPIASTSILSVSRFATPEELLTASNNSVMITPSDVNSIIDGRIQVIAKATTDIEGSVKFSNSEELKDSGANTVISPSNIETIIYNRINDAFSANTISAGFVKLASIGDTSNTDVAVTPSDINSISNIKINEFPGIVRLATSQEVSDATSTDTAITPMAIDTITSSINITNLPSAIEQLGIARFADINDINDIEGENSTDTLASPYLIKEMVIAQLTGATAVNINNLFDTDDPMRLTGELEDVSSSVDGNNRQVNIITKLSTNLQQPGISDTDIMQVISNDESFKTLSDEGIMSDVFLYDGIANELRIRWGAHSLFSKISLGIPPFRTSLGDNTNNILTGLIFEMSQTDNESYIGRTLRLRVSTRLGLGMIYSPTTLNNDNIVLNGNPIVLLDSTTDTGIFELEFKCIDGISVSYLGKKQVIASQVIMK